LLRRLRLRSLYRSLREALRIPLLLHLLLHLLLTLLQFLQKLLWSFYRTLSKRILRRRLLLIFGCLRLVSLVIRGVVVLRHGRICGIIPRPIGVVGWLWHTRCSVVLSCGEVWLLGSLVHSRRLRDQDDAIQAIGICEGTHQHIIEMGAVQQRSHDIAHWTWAKPANHAIRRVSGHIDGRAGLAMHGPQNISQRCIVRIDG